MLDRDPGALERRGRIARRFRRIGRAHRQRERAEAGEQVCNRLRAGGRFAHGLHQRRLAIRGRLEEAADRELHRHARQV